MARRGPTVLVYVAYAPIRVVPGHPLECKSETEKTVPRVVRIERTEYAPMVCQNAFNAGDLDRLVNLFEPEAVMLSPRPGGHGTGRNPGSIRAFTRDLGTVGDLTDQPLPSG
jgi:hypothetical protein